MVKKGKGILIGAIVVLILAALGAGGYQYKKNHSTNSSAKVETQVQQTVITYAGEDGKTAYDILKSNYQVEADTSSFGVMVKSINGLKATDKLFWLYSVNGKSADVAADKYFTKADDQIKWEYKGF